MRTIDQSTARSISVFMLDAADHASGKTGLTLTITASKAGAAFASISPTVTELGNGWYEIELTASHTDTLGDLALHITGAGADPNPVVVQVEAASATQVSAEYLVSNSDAILARLSSSMTDSGGGVYRFTVSALANAPVADAKKARQFITNKRTLEVLSATQWRYDVYEDDGTTVAYQTDYDPTTGEKAVV